MLTQTDYCDNGETSSFVYANGKVATFTVCSTAVVAIMWQCFYLLRIGDRFSVLDVLWMKKKGEKSEMNFNDEVFGKCILNLSEWLRQSTWRTPSVNSAGRYLFCHLFALITQTFFVYLIEKIFGKGFYKLCSVITWKVKRKVQLIHDVCSYLKPAILLLSVSVL